MQARAMKGANEKFEPSYIYMTRDFKGPKVEGSIVLRPGSHWFVMTNNLTQPAKLRLQCWMVKK